MKISIGLFFFIVFLLPSCSDKPANNIPNVSDIDANLDIIRTEELIYSGDTSTMTQILASFESSFPVFSNLYFQRILGFPPESDPNFDLAKALLKMKQDPGIKFLLDTTAVVFSDFDPIRKSLEQSFQFYHHYFPERNKPAIYTLISEYAHQVFLFSDETERDAIGLGLDLFLGSEFNYRQIAPDNPSFSSYITRGFNKDHIPKKVMEVLIDDMLPENPGNRLLDHIIRNGKKLYILEKLLPYQSDTIINEYSSKQMQWVINNELNIWVHLLDNNLLYSTKSKDYFKLINPSPNSPGMPTKSPGRAANWMGYKIVKKFMEKNDNFSLQDLIFVKDAQFLLEDSKYKPPRR